MKERKCGEHCAILTNTDLEILNFLINKNSNKKPPCIMEVTNKIKISHIHVSRRLKKLEEYRLIIIGNEGRRNPLYLIEDKTDFIKEILKTFKDKK
ncbi:MAG: hypothetical protein WC867_04905 [Candidatus Pacearchaeota archaeon]|jgi:DNA-binding transcriptional regulator GbsR (MarR family)